MQRRVAAVLASLALAGKTAAESTKCTDDPPAAATPQKPFFDEPIAAIRARLDETGYALVAATDGDIVRALEWGVDAVVAKSEEPFFYDGGYFARGSRGARGVVYDVGASNGSLTLAPHNELAYGPRTPRFIAFGAERAATGGGGETTLVDGHALFDGLDATWRDAASSREVRYRLRFDDVDPAATRKKQTSWRDAFGAPADAETASRRAKGMGYDTAAVDGRDNSVRVAHDLPAVVAHPTTGRPALFEQLLGAHGSALDAEPDEAPLDMRDRLHHSSWVLTDGDDMIDSSEIELEDDFRAALKALTEELTVEVPVPTGSVLLVDNVWHKHGRLKFRGDRSMLVTMRGAFRGDAAATIVV